MSMAPSRRDPEPLIFLAYTYAARAHNERYPLRRCRNLNC
jgi:hypothetical protein